MHVWKLLDGQGTMGTACFILKITRGSVSLLRIWWVVPARGVHLSNCTSAMTSLFLKFILKLLSVVYSRTEWSKKESDYKLRGSDHDDSFFFSGLGKYVWNNT